jgi:hypothetical protein
MRIAVATSTSAAAVNSARAEWRMATAPSSVPSIGRWRLQFHAPRAKTPATRQSFTMSV